MGIGRREFLRVFGPLLATIATKPSTSACLLDDTYVNRQLGIGFTKPHGWSFADAEEMAAVKTGQLLEIDDAEYAASLIESADLPYVAVKGPELQSNKWITPSAQFYLTRDPSEISAEDRVVEQLLQATFGKPAVKRKMPVFTPPMQVVRRDWQGCRGLLAQFRVTSLPQEACISNCRAAEYTARLLYRHVEIPEGRTIRMKTIAVESQKRFHLIRLSDSEEYPFDFSSFLSTLRIV
jgi:hypothetical protein